MLNGVTFYAYLQLSWVVLARIPAVTHFIIIEGGWQTSSAVRFSTSGLEVFTSTITVFFFFLVGLFFGGIFLYYLH